MAVCVMAICIMPLRYAVVRYVFLRYASFSDGHLQNRLVAIQLWILDDFISNTDHWILS